MAAVIEPGLTSVIVVTANSGPLASQCIDRLLASSALLEVIVVDNASSDGQVERIQSRFGPDARLRVLRNADNVGFGPACNQAADLAHGDWLLILNPDCLVEPDTISRLRECAASLPQSGILGVSAVSPDGRGDRASRRRDPSLRRALCSLSGLARFERRWPAFSGIEMPALAEHVNTEVVDAVSGACLFVRRYAFEKIGGFDEEYFLHCEDLDLCRRMRGSGFDVIHVPSILLRHEQGSSSHRRPLFVSRHKHRGMWRYFRKFDRAAKNPILSGVVWCGIWSHYAILAPILALKQKMRRRI